MAIRPDIALEAAKGVSLGPAIEGLGGAIKDVRQKNKQEQLTAITSALQGVMATPQEQRTPQEVKRQVETLERTLGIDIPEDELLKDVNEDGFIPDSALKPLATSLGIDLKAPEREFVEFGDGGILEKKTGAVTREPKKKEMFSILSADELKVAGFPKDAVVQQDPTGQFKVVQQGTTPLEKLKKDTQNIQDKTALENIYRGEVIKLQESIVDKEDSYNRLISSQDNETGTGPSDLTLMVNFMKIIDPGAAVQEGDKTNFINTAAIDDKIFEQWEKVSTGGFLTNKQRSQYVNQATKMYKQAFKDYQKRAKGYEKPIINKGLNRENVFVYDPELLEYDTSGFFTDPKKAQKARDQATGAAARRQRRQQAQPAQQNTFTSSTGIQFTVE